MTDIQEAMRVMIQRMTEHPFEIDWKRALRHYFPDVADAAGDKLDGLTNEEAYLFMGDLLLEIDPFR